jgi:hypothetical protein
MGGNTMSQKLTPTVKLSSKAGSITQRRKQEGSILGMSPMLLLFAVPVLLYGLTAKGMQGVSEYWQYFLVFIAFYSLFSGWSQAYLRNHSRLWYLVRQIVHWGALIGMLYLLNTQGIRMLMNEHQYTILLTYLVAFSVLLVAVHTDIKMLFFGVFMAYCAFLIAVPDNNPALIALGQQIDIADATSKPFQMTAGLAAAGFVATLFIKFFVQSAAESKRSRS